MKKKIAVLVRDRQSEALRMAVGLTLENDEVNVFMMAGKLEIDDAVSLNLEVLKELKVPVYSDNPDNNFQVMSTEDIAKALVQYDIVIPY